VFLSLCLLFPTDVVDLFACERSYSGTTMITTEEKEQLVERFGNGPNDTGTPEVQIAIFTKRIQRLTDHLDQHPNDDSTRHGLLELVGKRRRLLNYLKEHEIERYRSITDELDLRS